MSAPSKRKKRPDIGEQLAFKFNLNDERIPKMLGLLCILASVYLLVAFTSYLFTWTADQDLVQDSNWGLLFDGEAEVSNWLGRLGAVVAYNFFNLLLGLPSFGFVFLSFITGVNLVKKIPLSRFRLVYISSIITMVWASAFLAFMFNSHLFQSGFPWGGKIGQSIVYAVSDFAGVIGLTLFMLFTLGLFLVWQKNPDFEDISVRSVKRDLLDSLNFSKYFGFGRKDEYEDEEDEDETAKAAAKTKAVAKTKKTGDSPFGPELPFDDVFPNTQQELGIEDDVAYNFDDEPSTDLPTLAKRTEELTNHQLSIEIPEYPNLDDFEEEVDYDPEDNKEKIIQDFQEGSLSNIEKIAEDNWQHLEPYDPTLDLPSFENPVMALLEKYDDQAPVIDRAELETNKDQIVNTLLNYKIEITKIKATIGPTVTLYEIIPAPGVRISKIKNLEDDIALNLAALGIRIIAPIPGKGTIGIEVPNRNKQIVSMREVLESEKFRRAKMDLPIALGKTISNEVYVADLAKMPHLLVAGATGQGKSVGINAIIMSMLYKKHPSQVKLVLIDPKKVELSPYNKIDYHYLAYLPGEEEAIVTDTSKVVATLHSLTMEMDERYNLLKKANVRNLTEYNQKFVSRRLNPDKGHRFLPFFVLVIDEFADLIMTAGKDVEMPIARLAQLARAVGIHLVIATQRPSVNIITGIIKANFPARLAFKVTSKIDSRTILDAGGAEQLIGRGDMLLSVGGDIIRLQCAFIDTPEVERVIEFIANQRGYPEPFYLPAYDEGGGDGEGGNLQKVIDELDEHFEEAARLVVIHQSGSTSMIQRRLKLGYNRAGRIMDQLEVMGIVGAAEGSKPREVFFSDEVELERFLVKVKEKFG